MQTVFFLVARIILRREQSFRKLTMLTSRAKTYEEVRIESNIVAKLLRQNRKRAIYVTVLFRHISRRTFRPFFLREFPIRHEFTLWLRKYGKPDKQYDSMTEIWRLKYEVRGRK